MITLENITKQYGKGKNAQIVLHDVSFEINSKELVVLKGLSGAGKSTLLGLIGGLLFPSKGKIEVNGKIVNKLKANEAAEFRRGTVGILLQDPFLFSRLSVLYNIALPLLISGASKKEAYRKAEKNAAEVHLSDCLHRNASTLSGGQAQRAAFARALIGGAKIFLADEPTSNLDHKTAEAIIDLMLDLKNSRGLTILVASHDERLISKADRIIQVSDNTISFEK